MNKPFEMLKTKEINRRGRQRNSNIELLRIVSMMLVMLVHYLPLREPVTRVMILENPLNALFDIELHSISVVCVHCFILISGFFGIKWNRRGLLFQLLFWAFAGYLIARFLIEPYYHTGQSYSLKNFFNQMIDWYTGRWFVSAYITLYILSPLINSFVNRSSEKELLKYILVFYLFSTVFGYFMHSKEFATGLSAISLAGLYLIGAWLKKSTLSVVTWNKKYDLLAFITCTFILTASNILLYFLNIRSSLYGYLNPLVIIESIFLFQFFRKLNIGTVPWINFFSISAFSAFLLHCHPFVGDACNYLWKTIDSYFPCSAFFVFLSIILIFAISVLIDKMRTFLWYLICRACGKGWNMHPFISRTLRVCQNSGNSQVPENE